MPRTFAQVYDLYRQAQQDPEISKMSLEDFSRGSNLVTGSNDFSAGQDNFFGANVKKGSYWLDQLLNKTGIPEAVGSGSASLFGALGANPETGREIGHGLLRTATDFLPMTVAGALAVTNPELSIPALLTSGALGAANAYEKTDSVGSAAIGGLTPVVGSAGAHLAGRALSETVLPALAQRLPGMAALGLGQGTLGAAEEIGGQMMQPFVLKTAGDKLANVIGGQVGATAAMEGLGAFDGGLEKWKNDPWSSFLGATVGNLPFMGHDLMRMRGPMVTSVRPVESGAPEKPLQETVKVTPEDVDKVKRDFEFQKRQEEIEAMTNEEEKERARAAADLEFGIIQKKQAEVPVVDNENKVGPVPVNVAMEEAKTKFADDPLVQSAAELKAQEARKAQETQERALLTEVLTKRNPNKTPEEIDSMIEAMRNDPANPKKAVKPKIVDPDAPEFDFEKVTVPDVDSLRNIPVTDTLAKVNVANEALDIPPITNVDAERVIENHLPTGATIEEAVSKTNFEFQSKGVRQVKAKSKGGNKAGPKKPTQENHKLFQQYADAAATGDLHSQAVIKTVNSALRSLKNAPTNVMDRVANALAHWHESKSNPEVKFGDNGPALHGLMPEPQLDALGGYIRRFAKYYEGGRAESFFKDENGKVLTSLNESDPRLLEKAAALNAQLEADDMPTRYEVGVQKTDKKGRRIFGLAEKLKENRTVSLDEPLSADAINSVIDRLMVEDDASPEFLAAKEISLDTIRSAIMDGETALENRQLANLAMYIEKEVKADSFNPVLTRRKLDVMLMGNDRVKLQKLVDGLLKTVPVEQLAAHIQRVRENHEKFLGAFGEKLISEEGLSTPLGGTLDLRPSFENSWGMALEKQGWSKEMREMAAPFMQKVKEVMGLDMVKWGEVVNDATVNGKALFGLAKVGAGPMRAYLAGVKEMKMLSKDQQARAMAFFAAHEGAHLVRTMRDQGLLGEEGARAFDSFEKYANTVLAEERAETLGILADGLLPKKMRNLPEVADMLNVSDPEEFMANAQAVWAMGQMDKSTDAQLSSLLAPHGVRAWMSTVAQKVREFFGAIKTAFMVRKEEGDSEMKAAANKLLENITNLRMEVNKAQEKIAQFQGLFNVDSDSFEVLKASAFRSINDHTLTSGAKDLARLAAREFTFDSKWDKFRRGLSEWFEPLEQLAARHKEAASVVHDVLEIPKNTKQIETRVLSVMRGGFDPMAAAFKFKGPEAQDYKIVEQPKENRVYSDILNWSNLQLTKSKGQREVLDLANPPSSIKAKLDTLTQRSRQAVINVVARTRESMKLLDEHIMDYTGKRHEALLAHVIGQHITDYSKAPELAQMIKNVVLTEASGDIKGAMAQMAVVAKFMPDMEARAGAIGVAKDAIKAQAELQQFFDERTDFTSVKRVGNTMIKAFDAKGNLVNAQAFFNEAEARQWASEQRQQHGQLTFKTEKVSSGHKVNLDENLVAALEKVEGNIKRKMQQLIHDPVVLDELNKDFDLFGELKKGEIASQVFLPGSNRKMAPGYEDLNMLRVHDNFVAATARRLSLGVAKAQLMYKFADPALKDSQHIVDQVKRGLQNYVSPDSELGSAIAKFNAVYFLGGNVTTHIAELMQPFFTVAPEMRAMGAKPMKIAKMIAGVTGDVLNFYVRGNGDLNKWRDPEERRFLQSAAERGLIGAGHLSEVQESSQESALDARFSASRGRVAEVGELATRPIKAYADFTMNLYRRFTAHNAKLSLLLGFRLARERGENVLQAEKSAEQFADVTTGSSGRAGRPVAPYEGNKLFGQVAFSLTRYINAYTAMNARYIQHGMFGKEMGLTSKQRSDARGAALMMMGTQFAAAGALGLPFMGAAATLLEKLTGKDIKGSIYEQFGAMMDEDKKDGGLIADVVMRGAANAMTNRLGVPVDLSSKFAVGGLPGLSEMEGVSADSLWGATGSMVKSLATGMTKIASEGDVIGAVKASAPPAWRKAVDLWANGDATTASGKPLGLREGEKSLYALGFTPDRVRKLRDLDKYQQQNDKIASAKEARTVAQVVDLFDRDPEAAKEKLDSIIAESDYNERKPEWARKIADKIAEKRMGPVDPRKAPTRKGAEEAERLMRGMGVDFGAPREEARLRLKMDVMNLLGVNPMSMNRSVMEAQHTDALAEENPFAAFRGFDPLRPQRPL